MSPWTTLVAGFCAVSLVGTPQPEDAAEAIPAEQTPIAKLGAGRFEHAELLRVRRDFGKSDVEIALDAWVEHTKIPEVRLWWSDAEDRWPFDGAVARHVDVDYRRMAKSAWRITVTGDGKEFRFRVGLRGGEPAVFTAVNLPDGRIVRKCKADRAKLYARRFLGVAVGVRDLVVVCEDPGGELHRATVVYRDVRGERAEPNAGS